MRFSDPLPILKGMYTLWRWNIMDYPLIVTFFFFTINLAQKPGQLNLFLFGAQAKLSLRRPESALHLFLYIESNDLLKLVMF